jgi:hypothetical protein
MTSLKAQHANYEFENLFGLMLKLNEHKINKIVLPNDKKITFHVNRPLMK